MTHILVIPDTHCRPGESLERFHLLADLIREAQPERIVMMGDHWDMPSLCRYDEKKVDFKLREIKRDIEVGLNALEILCNARGRVTTANIDLLGGNHDDARVDRFLSEDSRFKGLLKRPQEYLKDLPVNWTPYQKVLKIDGVCFSHHFPSGIMNKPIGGENPAATLLKKMHMSCVSGHQHSYDYAERIRADGSRICGLMSGCFVNPNYNPSYAGAARPMWRIGASWLKTTTTHGEFDLSFLSYKTLKERYS